MTAYEVRISDWSSDVCSSDLGRADAGLRLARAHGAEFDLLVIGRAENQALHIDSGEVDRVGVEAADGDDFLDLGDADLCRGRHRLVEVARGLAEDEVAALVGLPPLDEREVGEDAAFEEIILSDRKSVV